MTKNKTSTGNHPSLDDLISLEVAGNLSGLSHGHLSLLIRRGHLWGTKIGGRDWFTTEKALRAYLESSPKPGPKPKQKA